MQVGHAPLVGQGQAVSVFVWLAALSYLYVELTTDERTMGVFIIPLPAAVHRAADQPDPTERPAVLDRRCSPCTSSRCCSRQLRARLCVARQGFRS